MGSIIVTTSENNGTVATQSITVSANPYLSSVGVSIPMPINGYYTVSAVGVCGDGTKTQQSNTVSVYSYSSGGTLASPPPPPPPPPPSPPSYRVIGINVGGTLWYNPNLSGPGTNWVNAGSGGYNPGICSLSGSYGAVVTTGTALQTNLDVSNTAGWVTVTTPVSPVRTAIGANKQGIVLDFGNGNMYYTSDMTVANPSWGSAILSPSGNQIVAVVMGATNGNAVLGYSTSALFYMADASAGTPSWGPLASPPSPYNNIPVSITLSGTSAGVVDNSGNIFYTSDVTAGSIVWSQITAPTCQSGSTGPDYVSISGYQIVILCSTSNAGDNNIFVANDVRSISWTNPAGQLTSVAMSS